MQQAADAQARARAAASGNGTGRKRKLVEKDYVVAQAAQAALAEEAAQDTRVKVLRDKTERAAMAQAAKDKAQADHAAAKSKAPPETADGFIVDVADDLQPGFDDFFAKFGKDECGTGGQFKNQCCVFFGASLLVPSNAVTTSDVLAGQLLDYLLLYPAISKELVAAMQHQWLDYKTLAMGVDPEFGVLAFFELHQKKLGAWGEAAKLLAIMPSSSAAAERVFSLLRHLFGKKSYSTLEDKIELGLMRSINGRPI
jgi:hypothetical protein